MNKNIQKTFITFIASLMAVVLIASGTFAWNAFDQEAINMVIGTPTTAAGRLHDDFNGKNKDVYVENYSDIEDDVIYVRIRLDEYMEIGDGAGTDAGLDNQEMIILRGDKEKGPDITPVFNDVTTWDTYLYGSDTQGDDIRFYRNMSWGGSTIYMPTFNKNQDSLEADINGTIEGPDGDIMEDVDAYADYVVYTDGETLTKDAMYDIDDNTIDEEDASIEGTNHEFIEEIHTAKPTLTSQVMSMAQWKAAGSKLGPYWV